VDGWIAIQVLETSKLNAGGVKKTPDKILGLFGERVAKDHPVGAESSNWIADQDF
jgi:hypothetical protein